MELAPAMTWKLVTMFPCRSQTKPEPEPWGTSNRFIDQKSRCSAAVVMKTTDREAFSNTWMVACSSGVRSAGGATSRGFEAAGGAGSPWTQEIEPRTATACTRSSDAARANKLFMAAGEVY